jgi:hypothetical protein
MTQRPAPTSSKRVVIARDTDGQLFVVGPVFSEATVSALAEEVRGEGWPIECVSASLVSRAEFRG